MNTFYVPAPDRQKAKTNCFQIPVARARPSEIAWSSALCALISKSRI
jgi:hypothetical protein